ncbi:MAG: imidazoleglycerol-phosphate dehydratase HisB [Eubacteriaceae bacterium]|nr:imidazoleglycerol-phosphate dehydratase HisB [Eubacteriaceae bacterium]
MRKTEIERNTNETRISLALSLDEEGYNIDTGIGFLDHMLTLLCKHGGFKLELKAIGDTYVDSHHLTEDIGICFGAALAECLGDKNGIARYGSAIIPMDESLALCAIDLSGRPFCCFDANFPAQRLGVFETEAIGEFMNALASSAKMNLHVRLFYGQNTHHIAEAIFKALAKSLQQAIAIVGDGIPSTKGVL